MTNEKKQNGLKLTAVLLAIITIVTACIIGVCRSVNGKKQDTLQAEIAEPEFEFSENKVYDMPKAMAFTAQTLAAAQANGQTVDVAIKANVTPYDAANQLVDFSVAWGTAPTHGKEAVTDYVTVTQESDGSLNATISCKKAFGSDKIIVTVTTRDGGFTANCTVSFVGVASTMSITNDTLNPISDTKRGVYYQLGTNKTYNFTVNLDNMFNTVGSKNLTVALGGVGELYFGDEFSDGTGMSSFSNMAKRKMSDIANKFITSATISGNTLTIKTGASVLENYYDEMVTDTEYYTGTTYKGRYVYEDEYSLVAGENFDTNSKANIAALPSCYFTITVKDTVSGLSETLRVWLVTSVKSVRLDKTMVNI